MCKINVWPTMSKNGLTSNIFGRLKMCEVTFRSQTWVTAPLSNGLGPGMWSGPITCQTAERYGGVKQDLCPFSATAVLWLAQLCPFRVMLSDRCSWLHISAAPRCSNSLFVTFSPVISFTQHNEKTTSLWWLWFCKMLHMYFGSKRTFQKWFVFFQHLRRTIWR